MIRDAKSDAGPVRALFLDPDAVLSSERVAAAWSDAAEHEDPARAMFLNAVDPEAVARLNQVLDRVPDLVLVISSHWRLLWTVGQIADMLHQLGYRGTRFSGTRVDRGDIPTRGISSWIATMVETQGREVRYAVWAEEVPSEHLGHLAVGAPRTAQLLIGDPS